MKYIAKEIGELERRPNEWKGIKVGVFRIENGIETQIGEYERNYSMLFDSFCYFQKDGKDFALYSPDIERRRESSERLRRDGRASRLKRRNKAVRADCRQLWR